MMRRGVQGPLAKSGNTPPPELVYSPPPDNGLDIVYSDEDILVLSKPAGLLSVPGNRPELEDCLESRVMVRFPSATTVHRLDRATSGVSIMALNLPAHRHLGLQFEKRLTEKIYIAIVDGHLEPENGTIKLPLRTDWYNRPKQMVDPCLGREAITNWRVIEKGQSISRVQLNPETGRSHQLRVHMQSLGHPIIGDEFYAPENIIAMSERLMLHAESIEISHPGTGEKMRFRDPCPF